MLSVKDSLLRLDDALKKAKELGVDPKKQAISSSSLVNFKEKRKEHYHSIIKNCFNLIKEEIDKTEFGGLGFKSNLGKCERTYLSGNIEEALNLNEKIIEFVGSFDKSKVMSDLNISLKGNLPLEIKKEIEEDFKELRKCFDARCYRSVLVLCGRILEIALHRKYYEATGVDVLEKSPGIGLGTLVAKLKEKDIKLDPGILQQIHLINQIRVFSVHKKKEEFNPSKEQAHAMILYTLDIISKLF